MTSIYHLRPNKEPNQVTLTDKLNIYHLASTVNRQSNGVDGLDTSKTVVVGKRFKLLAKRGHEPAQLYSVRILPNIISDLKSGFLNLNDNLAEQLLGLRLNCLHSLKSNDFGFDRIFISPLK
tara:strand:+ start:2399 stop:2764 length:366 start_codon:yes stop_codon:yes gene_type:complete